MPHDERGRCARPGGLAAVVPARRAAGAAAAVILTAVAGPAQAVTAGCPRAALSEVRRAFAQDMRMKNLEHVLGLYDPAAEFFDDDRVIRRPDQLRRLFIQVFAQFDSDMRLEAGEIRATPRGGRISCTETGRYAESLTRRATGEVRRVRRGYRFVYAPGADGRWRFLTMDWRPR